jgi:hypothetical protein
MGHHVQKGMKPRSVIPRIVMWIVNSHGKKMLGGIVARSVEKVRSFVAQPSQNKRKEMEVSAPSPKSNLVIVAPAQKIDHNYLIRFCSCFDKLTMGFYDLSLE